MKDCTHLGKILTVKIY